MAGLSERWRLRLVGAAAGIACGHVLLVLWVAEFLFALPIESLLRPVLGPAPRSIDLILVPYFHPTSVTIATVLATLLCAVVGSWIASWVVGRGALRLRTFAVLFIGLPLGASAAWSLYGLAGRALRARAASAAEAAKAEAEAARQARIAPIIARLPTVKLADLLFNPDPPGLVYAVKVCGEEPGTYTVRAVIGTWTGGFAWSGEQSVQLTQAGCQSVFLEVPATKILPTLQSLGIPVGAAAAVHFQSYAYVTPSEADAVRLGLGHGVRGGGFESQVLEMQMNVDKGGSTLKPIRSRER